jgi:hypothetical protein
MKNYSLNLFKLNNLSELDFSYRLVDFTLIQIEGQEEMFNKQLHKVALQVSSLTGGPSAIVKRNGKFYVAIPSDRSLDDATINVVPHNIKISLLPEIISVNVSSVTEDNVDVVFKFLDFEIRKQLQRSPLLWKLNSAQFFAKKPIYTQGDSSIQVYEGFSYKLVRLADGNFYTCLDLSTKYIDKNFLSSYINTTNHATITSLYRGRRFLYLNGDNWYATEFVGLGESIEKHEFDDEGQSISVYDYILKNARGRKDDIAHRIKPADPTMFYRYPGRTMEPHSGASSLAKMLYSPKDKEVQALHSYSIKGPTDRFEAIEKYIKEFFQGISYNKTTLKISVQPAIEKVQNFSMPELKFHNNQLLKVGSYSSGGTTLREFAAERKHLLLKNGVISQALFDEQFLIVPEELEKNLVEAFKRNLEFMIKKLAPQFPGFTIIRYKSKLSQAATFQIQEIEQILERNNAVAGFALFVLPDLAFDSGKFVKGFHDILKNKFYPNLKIQCASAYKVRNFFKSFPSADAKDLMVFKVPEDKKFKFESYLVNLVLEHLIVNRKWPYALNKKLHCDIYIGIDVHDRHAGFCFFFKNGENIFFHAERVPLKNRSQRAEKLKARLIKDVIATKLKAFIPMFCPDPNAIVIIRDGKSFGEEGKALTAAIRELEHAGLVPAGSVRYGVVDLRKQSAVPLRIASHSNGHDKLENPVAGAFKKFNDHQAFLYNTGHPFQIRGSAKPLQLTMKEGDVSFDNVIEDIFCQTMLAFSAPDRSNSLPIAIKLIDTLLEPLSAAVDRVDEDEDEFEDTPVEQV